MLILRKGSQPDYRLCNQTVTVYHREGLTRQVFEKAFYEYTRQRARSAGVDTHEEDFLLVIPGNEQMLFPGDRVVLGVGPEIRSWGELNRQNFPTLSEIGQVRCRFFGGRMVHCEGK